MFACKLEESSQAQQVHAQAQHGQHLLVGTDNDNPTVQI